MIRRSCLWVVVASAVSGAGAALRAEPAAAGDEQAFAQTFPHACVAADHPLASAAGAGILRQGGNVVDAAVATAFALAVVRPESSGIGGGGFMVIWDAAKQEAVAIDYRERAPSAATRDMYAPQAEDIDSGLSRRGGLAVAVPGQVAGLCYALEHYGTLDLKTVLEPAIRLAREGFRVDATFAESQAEVLEELKERPRDMQRFSALRTLYLNAGAPQSVGERFQSPLADVLERIAENGRDAFYRGLVAESIVAEIQRQGGIITRDDLEAMQPVVREPLRGRHRGYDVVTMPPPSSGGIAVLETLNILAAYERLHPDRSQPAPGESTPERVHLVTEAMKHAFADRAEFLGDADFADVPIARLLSTQHAERLAGRIDPDRTLKLTEYGRFAAPDDAGTSHFCIIDRQGNALACTETVNTLFGSLVVEPRFGIVLNNQMDDFAAVPGRPNTFGLIQSEANAVAPGKRPLSSMSPTILVRDGKAAIVAGGSGGPRIISGTLETLLNLTTLERSPSDAVTAPRFHHQWLPDVLLIEPELWRTSRSSLEERGHMVRRSRGLCVVQAAVRTDEGVTGVSDPRKGGLPAGY